MSIRRSPRRVLAVALPAVLIALPMAMAVMTEAAGPPAKPWVVAHRGAAAYAPENTVPAFTLAAEQGATFVEFDLQRTRDGALVLLHDTTLERTTDVEEVFPDRARQVMVKGESRRQWPLADFTLAEIRRLDAGRWFDPRFTGTRMPTFGETIAALRGKSGLFIELKAPDLYPGIEAAMLAELKSAGLDQPWADPRTPVLLQSFTISSLQILARDLRTTLPIHLLFGPADAAKWTTEAGLAEARTFATGLSPDKQVVRADPTLVRRAHAVGMPVTPYTFRASAVGSFADVGAEMRDALAQGVDGVITDNPDKLKPR
jgi:glycerophosphoryl diester phosphodiesterase